MIKVVHGDITEAKTDIIVNAANGIGFMGGWIGKYMKLPGVAESIHFVTKGSVEREAKKKSKKVVWLSRIICGHSAGEIYVTHAGSLSSKWIVHAVTMRYPGMKTTLHTVDTLLTKIVQEGRLLQARSVAIPLLGAGTGGLQAESVLDLYDRRLSPIEDLQFNVFIYK